MWDMLLTFLHDVSQVAIVSIAIVSVAIVSIAIASIAIDLEAAYLPEQRQPGRHSKYC